MSKSSETDKKLLDLFRTGVLRREEIQEIMFKPDPGVVVTPVGRFELEDFRRLYILHENNRIKLVDPAMVEQAPRYSTVVPNEEPSTWGRFIAWVKTIRISFDQQEGKDA